jgi:hypothetical protein
MLIFLSETPFGRVSFITQTNQHSNEDWVEMFQLLWETFVSGNIISRKCYIFNWELNIVLDIFYLAQFW